MRPRPPPVLLPLPRTGVEPDIAPLVQDFLHNRRNQGRLAVSRAFASTIEKCPTATRTCRTINQGVTDDHVPPMGHYTGVVSHHGFAREFPSGEADASADPRPLRTDRAPPMGQTTETVPLQLRFP